MQFLLAVEGAVAQGLLWAILALGSYITFRLLNFTDMTVDGSFTTGACVTAICIANGIPPIIALLISFVAGGLAGGITGFLHNKLEIPEVLAGILTQISLYSINLRILGRANQQLLQYDTIFKQVQRLFASIGLELSSDRIAIVIGLFFVILVILVLYWFFGTEIGSMIRATGNNEAMVRALGQNTEHTKFIALIIANSCIAIAGSLVGMYQGAADVGMGAGAIVIGLASIVIGEVILRRVVAFGSKMIAVVVGSVIYRIIVALVLQLGLSTNDLKLITALIVALALFLPNAVSKHNAKKARELAAKESQNA
ncbi:MAG: ABC transporter permease [Clostridiaceae bacterium]|jgi:putative ABC transport system permease protein|nr:ABC transporter permease [Bacillota bacterium]NLN52571.1 ABC transporter permease [Clostridiaceae bacterium]